jgi:murein DD-endopeptidase MepM/ murein hydrolase activator NlpD
MNIEEGIKKILETLTSLIQNVKSNGLNKRSHKEKYTREIVYSDHKNVHLMRLIKNRKVVVASISVVLTFTVGMMSMVSFLSTELTENGLTRIDKSVDTFNLLDTKEVIEVTTNENVALDMQISEQNPLEIPLFSFKEMRKKLELPVLFNSFTTCFVLRVDEEVLGYFKTKEEAQAILDKIIDSNVQKDAELLDVGFAENVKLDLEDVSIYDFTEYAVAADVEELIKIGTNEKRTYLVQSGDVPGSIAEKHGMGLSQLYAANPGLQEQKYLQIDQQLSLVVPVPLINVQTKQRITRFENISYETVNENSNNLYVGESSVKVRGVNGKIEIVEDVTKINGELVSDKTVEVSKNVVAEPTTRVLYVGTKPPPPKIGTGTFARPLSRSYTISSPFGSRWGRLHTGIDLALPTGSPVLAADGGKVIFSGNQGTYGLLVIIDHGGNLSSYYAHNSKLLVKKGDEVFKGQKISLSGNTGRSTGPHLHFEIRKNNVPINPTKYLSF